MSLRVISEEVVVTTAGTRVQLKTSQRGVNGVAIKADSGNAGNIYVGGVDVDDSNGYPLAFNEELGISPGQLFVREDLRLDQTYIDADNDGEKVRILYFANST